MKHAGTLVLAAAALVGCGALVSLDAIEPNPGVAGDDGGVDSTVSTTVEADGGGDARDVPNPSDANGASDAGDAGDAIDCASPLEACGSSCRDLHGDPDNCGACGHGCQGGACQDGGCQPVVVNSALALSLAIDDANLYWIGYQPNGVFQMPLDGGAVVMLANTQISVGSALAIDPVNVYWTSGENGDGGTVQSVPLGAANGPVTTLASDQAPLTGIALDAVNVYWVAGHQDGGVNFLPKGGDAGVRSAVSELTYAQAIAVGPDYVYWGDLWTIGRALLDGGDRSVVASGQDVPAPLLVRDGVMYWSDSAHEGLYRTPVGGGDIVELANEDAGHGGIALQGSTLLFTTGDGPLREVSIDGGPSPSLADGPSGYSIVANARTVYWATCCASPHIMKLAR